MADQVVKLTSVEEAHVTRGQVGREIADIVARIEMHEREAARLKAVLEAKKVDVRKVFEEVLKARGVSFKAGATISSRRRPGKSHGGDGGLDLVVVDKGS